MLCSNCWLLFQHLTSENNYCFVTKLGTKFSVNMTNIKSHKPYPILNIPSSLTLSYDIFLNILTESALIALQWEAILIQTLLNLHHTARKILPAIKAETLPQLKQPKEAINGQCWKRIDVENVENVKTVEQAGQKKGKKKKKKKSDRSREKKQEEREENAKREKEEQERLRKWEECWQRKLQAQEERDRAECCVEKGLCLKPKTQSNIWINVTQDRSIQEIQMHFKHVPVPKPKPPPLPPLRKQRPPEEIKANDVSVQKSTQKSAQKVDKKSGTGKKKRK